MHKMHLRQPEFRYAACVPFTKNKGRIKKKDSRYIYQNELHKVCF